MFANTKQEFNKSPSPQQAAALSIGHNHTHSQTSNIPSSTNANAIHHKTPKPNLKLNMGKQNAPGTRSLASVAGSIPSFHNSGPFSPGLFSAKRVWVKRPDGTATTIQVSQTDIIDDLKAAIMTKFPNALAKYFDPADITLKMDIHSRKVAASGSQPTKKMNVWASASPDGSKTLSSPVSTTFDKAQLNQHQNQPSSIPPSQQHSTLPMPALSTYSFINLEPDQNVWNLLDLYFPGGMDMSEAFIIDTPQVVELPHYPQPQATDIRRGTRTETPYTGSQPNLGNYYLSSASPSSAVAPQIPQSHARSITPNSLSGQGGYYHPKPQYMNNNNQLYKERSVSPSHPQVVGSSIANAKLPPLATGVHFHRRSQSNPPQSPVNSLAATGAGHKLPSNTTNNPAVLLLPKNFSLSSSSSFPPDKKRLSLDENLVTKNREQMNKNLSNLESPEEHVSVEPFPSIIPTDAKGVPKLSVNGENEEGPTPGAEGTSKGPLTMNKTSSMKDNFKGPNDVADSTKNQSEKSVVTRLSSGSKKLLGNKSAETVLPSISVLVVEDNAINQAILGAFLRKHKIHYEIAKNGEEAIAKWRKGGFHLVLMDIQLPVKSGIEATKEIRYLERVNRIGVFAEKELQGPSLNELSNDERLDLETFRSPVIIVALTASSNSSVDRSNALRAGCNDYLTKPVNLVWLQDKITEWGCMQALIDFDGWKRKRSNFNAESARKLAQKAKSRSRSNSRTKSLLGKEEKPQVPKDPTHLSPSNSLKQAKSPRTSSAVAIAAAHAAVDSTH